MTALVPIAPRLAKLLPLLASDKDGEVVATARAIGRALTGAGLDFHDLVKALTAPEPQLRARRAGRKGAKPASHGPSRAAPRSSVSPAWRDMVRWCCIHGVGHLNEREAEFVANMANMANNRLASRAPSDKQLAWLDAIFTRLAAEAA